jgi:broad specificity phosphatase PhoE
MKIALIPCAASEWQEQHRLLGRAELPPSPHAEADSLAWVEPLRSLDLREIYHGPDELATRTAGWLAGRLQVSTRLVRSLAEVDLGLWTGLTEDELEARYASAHRELCEAPLNVSAPAGESFAEADQRLRAFLGKQLKRNGARALGLVLRPVALALARAALAGEPPCVLDRDPPVRAPVILELHNGQLPAGAPGAGRSGKNGRKQHGGDARSEPT